MGCRAQSLVVRHAPPLVPTTAGDKATRFALPNGVSARRLAHWRRLEGTAPPRGDQAWRHPRHRRRWESGPRVDRRRPVQLR